MAGRPEGDGAEAPDAGLGGCGGCGHVRRSKRSAKAEGAAPCKGEERRGQGCYNEDDLMRPRRPPAGACDEDGSAARWEPATERIRSLRDSSGVRSRRRDSG